MLQWGSSKHPTRLLDVGSQIASLPLYALQFGICAAAVDNGDFANDCANAVRDLGVDYRITGVGEAPLPFADESFDFVTYMDVIEHHAYSPKRVLLEVRRVLESGGYLIITTPNHASLYNRLQLLCGKSVHDPLNYFFERCSANRVYPGHHREYTRAELRSVLEETGFRVVQCTTIEEGIAPQWRAFRREAADGWIPAFRKYGKFLVADSLGHLWDVLPGALGRILWAVAQKV
jgi:SAM-dependent methyltransferase